MFYWKTNINESVRQKASSLISQQGKQSMETNQLDSETLYCGRSGAIVESSNIEYRAFPKLSPGWISFLRPHIVINWIYLLARTQPQTEKRKCKIYWLADVAQITDAWSTRRQTHQSFSWPIGDLLSIAECYNFNSPHNKVEAGNMHWVNILQVACRVHSTAKQ